MYTDAMSDGMHSSPTEAPEKPTDDKRREEFASALESIEPPARSAAVAGRLLRDRRNPCGE